MQPAQERWISWWMYGLVRGCDASRGEGFRLSERPVTDSPNAVSQTSAKAHSVNAAGRKTSAASPKRFVADGGSTHFV